MPRRTTHLLKFIQQALAASGSVTTLPPLFGQIQGGNLWRPKLRLFGCQARNPSGGLLAAHTPCKSVLLDAVKTIREATSPQVNLRCVIILHRHGRTATVKPGSCMGHVLAYALRRLFCSRIFTVKEQRSLAVWDTAQPTGCQALRTACTDTSHAQVFFPLAEQ